jgi:hypothetical protein
MAKKATLAHGCAPNAHIRETMLAETKCGYNARGKDREPQRLPNHHSMGMGFKERGR